MMDRWLTDVVYGHNRCFMPTLVCCGQANSSPKVDDECRAGVSKCWLRRHGAHRTGDAQPVAEVGEGLLPPTALRTEGPGFDANQTARAFVYVRLTPSA